MVLRTGRQHTIKGRLKATQIIEVSNNRRTMDRRRVVHLSDRQGGRPQAVRKVHRLVCEAFNGPAPERTEVSHLDGDSLNNVADNLAWETHEENMQRTREHGTNFWANQTHCIHGHEFTPENTLISKRGGRSCLTCAAQRSRERRYADGAKAGNKFRTHCPKGHAYSGDNLIIRKNGSRGCRECQNIANREYRARLKKAA